MYTGNEKVWPFRMAATPAPRGHKVPVPGDTGGARLVVDLLLQRAQRLGVSVWYETAATNLIVDEGAVGGVAWRHFGDTGAVGARATVIAAGGFIMNEAMVAEHMPKFASAPVALGNSYDDGLGIRLGISAGGAARGMDRMFITAPPYPPGILLTGVIVDEPHLQMPKMPLVPLIDGWDTVAEMEAALRIPAGNLTATLQRYNDHARRGCDPDFHKHPDFLAPQDTAPWGAFDLSLGKAAYSAFTLGGLKTSVNGEVLQENTAPVPGLYAVGACASNLATDGKSYASGTQLGEGSFFGRRAGAHAARAAFAADGF
jgi:succinate dehydrogenase/fumarate reductase flavoprotein subunit